MFRIAAKDQFLTGRDNQPGVLAQFAFQLARSPTGITERDQATGGTGACRQIDQNIARGGQADTLFLEVFRWPRDGRLVVGGLNSGISGARVLGSSVPLRYSRLDSHDLVIQVPRQAPDTTSTVIAVTLTAPVTTYSLRLLSGQIENRLLAFDATLHGGGFSHGDGKATRH